MLQERPKVNFATLLGSQWNQTGSQFLLTLTRLCTFVVWMHCLTDTASGGMKYPVALTLSHSLVYSFYRRRKAFIGFSWNVSYSANNKTEMCAMQNIIKLKYAGKASYKKPVLPGECSSPLLSLWQEPACPPVSTWSCPGARLHDIWPEQSEGLKCGHRKKQTLKLCYKHCSTKWLF